MLCMSVIFFFSSRRRHTRLQGEWSSDVCSSDLLCMGGAGEGWPCGRLRRWRQCAAELAPYGWVADASRISGRLMDVLEPWGCLQISRLWVFPDVFGLSGCMRTSDLRGAGYYGKEGHWPQRACMLRPAMA